MNYSMLISIAALCISALMLFLTIKRDNKSNTNNDTSAAIRVAESFKEINVKLDFQYKQLDQLTESSRNTSKDFQQLSHKFVELESKVNTAFGRIDENRERIITLEGKE